MIHRNRSQGLAIAAMLTVGLAAGPLQAQSNDAASDAGMAMMGGMETEGIPRPPPVAGYAEGDRIFFVHTEASDADIAETLPEMMGSPVPVVPALADAPDSMLANVYAFKNGIQPKGPRGPLNYQPDIFDHPAGSDGYTPLRRIMLVTWKYEAEARLLTSAADVDAAQSAGEVEIRDSGIVVNMPFLTWPGGER